MKKILLVALLVLLPMSAYALEPMADSNLDEITAQEGVEIAFSGGGANGGLMVETQATDTAWTNRDGAIESGILCAVTQSEFNAIEVWGSLTIEAKQESGKDLVEIGLPNIQVVNAAKKSDIYITSVEHTAIPDDPSTPDVDESKSVDEVASAYTNFIGDGVVNTSDMLGSQYTSGAITRVLGGTIKISAM
ncbi:DUF6160 family protein [Desulfoluna spongiiphila]|uniref:DUF6160 family protein n=1 Tax=Desulfoluna spongiiphila TaxID=419481 RepID=UPI00125295EC|nr:DUF6160 family protein [Desulfoluna spongiiphila]VVS95212.1 hypothetical protein DBB_47890 [Desulfoluna spongiiphila]